jgi:flagellar biogenesis protein FliO
MSPEELAEVYSLTDLATGMSDGMRSLSAQNLARPVATYSNEVEPLPDELHAVPEYAERFIAWQFDRAQKGQHKAAASALWSSLDALHDARLYVRRKVWLVKVANQTIINPVARMLATTVELHKSYRSDVHEALNHAAKHNTDVKALGQDLRDALDEVVVRRLRETTERLAGEVLTALPALQQALLEGPAPTPKPMGDDEFLALLKGDVK